MISWRHYYLGSIGLRFVLALCNSYIHPDEHFQSLEVLASRVFGFSTSEPWEFTSTAPARSYAPLLLTYYPTMKVAQFLDLLPIQTWYLVRLLLMLVSWMVIDWCIYKMLPTKQERIKTIFFVLTSYVTLVYQSHTFSNSVETVLVVLTVYMLNELRFLLRVDKKQYSSMDIAYLGLGIGVCFAFGVFNRVTFPVFFVFPAYFYMICAWKWKFLPIVSALAFAVTAAVFVVVDTVIFTPQSLASLFESPFNFAQYVVAPLNNLIYNSDASNLAKHGLHPYYTHVLVNVPQLLGPGLLFLVYGFKNIYWLTTPFLAGVSGLFFLSIVPHQELRFLIPVVPLFCCCFDVTSFLGGSEKAPKLFPWVMNSWLLFNAALALLMGVVHQGGVVPALDHFHDIKVCESIDPVAIIWWRTYSPPTWMLGDKSNTTQFITVNDEISEFVLDPSKQHVVFDTMGSERSNLEKVFEAVHGEDTYLVAPIASFNQHFNASLFNLTWSYGYHLDMDHLDFSDTASLQPGLGIYKLL